VWSYATFTAFYPNKATKMRDVDYILEELCETCGGDGVGIPVTGSYDVFPCSECEGTGHKLDHIKYNAYIGEEYDKAFSFSH